MASNNWESFQIQLPGQDLLEPVRNVLETLVVFLEVLKTVLDTLKSFLIPIPNPLSALVTALITLVETLFQSLNQTGLYAYFDLANPSSDPNFIRSVGGYESFIQRFKGSLLDTRDPNRPQPVAGASQSGFVIILANSSSPMALMQEVNVLINFFDKAELKAQSRFAAPTNVKVLPMGDKNEPLTSLAKVLGANLKGISLQWTLGGTTNPPSLGFTDLASTIANEFIPPKWLIERSSLPLNGEVDIAATGVGKVTYMRTTDHEDRGQPGKLLKQKVPLHDEHGEPVIKFDSYKVLQVADDSGNLLSEIVNGAVGELGFVQYYDTDVVTDKVYYYRVRAFFGDLNISNGQVQWDTKPTFDRGGNPYLPWPGTNLVMGHPSGIFRQRLPPKLTNFDVLAALNSLFLAAISLNFHIPAGPNDKFTNTGANVPPTPVTHIGRGTLSRQAGVLSDSVFQPAISDAAKNVNTTGSVAVLTPIPTNAVDGSPVKVPWQEPNVQRQAGKLTHLIGSALLEQGSNAALRFQDLMQGALPGGPLKPSTPGISSATNVLQLVTNMTSLDSSGNYTQDTYNAWAAAFSDASCRQNILYPIQYLTAFTLGGTPPDWIQVTVLKDIVPWSGQLLYDILAKMKAMQDSSKGIFAEIAQFIALIERKISTLENFIEYLVSILNLILSLEGGFYVLFVPSIGGDVSEWFKVIDNAGGKPSSGPGTFSSGVAFAYSAPDVSAFSTALKLIF